MDGERIARLESDVAQVKVDVRELRQDVRRLDDKIDGVNKNLSEKLEGLKESIYSGKIWALGLYFALAAGMLAVMARGFKWI